MNHRMIPGTPRAEIAVDANLVRSLLHEQHPDLAEQSITLVETGWDNFIFQLGTQMALRLPRRARAAALILNEQRWLPNLATHLPITMPVPLRIGLPSNRYPWPWSVCRGFRAGPRTKRRRAAIRRFPSQGF